MWKAIKMFWILLAVIAASLIGVLAFLWLKGASTVTENNATTTASHNEIENLPAYSGNPFIEIDNNQPSFLEGDLTTKAFEYYSELDSLQKLPETERAFLMKMIRAAV